MKLYLHPKKQGAHRVACKALYRAILSQCPHLPIPDDRQSALCKLVKDTFWRNRHVQSSKYLTVALKAGYEAESLIRASAANDAVSTSRILALLDSLPPPKSPKPAPPAPPTHRPAAPFPGATPVLQRPFLCISGRRKIPVLTSTSTLPFLRFKKPQSPFLSRVLRNKIRQKERRWDLLYELQAALAVAQHEDEWDEIVGVRRGDDGLEGSWADVFKDEIHAVKRRLEAEEARRRELARKMGEIVQKERKLLEKEDQERKREKYRLKAERRASRKGLAGHDLPV